MKPHRMVEAGRHEAGRPEAHAVRQHRRGQKAHVRREGEEAAMDERVVADRRRDAEPLIMLRSEEHTSELQSLMRISYAVFCLKKKKIKTNITQVPQYNTTTETHIKLQYDQNKIN